MSRRADDLQLYPGQFQHLPVLDVGASKRVLRALERVHIYGDAVAFAEFPDAVYVVHMSVGEKYRLGSEPVILEQSEKGVRFALFAESRVDYYASLLCRLPNDIAVFLK